MARKYVYGFIESARPLAFGTTRMGGVVRAVHALQDQGLAAIVSTLDDSFDPASPLHESACVAEHRRVLERVFATQTLLPMKYGISVDSESGVRRLLRGGRRLLTGQLALVQDRVELQVVARWTPDRRAESGEQTTWGAQVVAEGASLARAGYVAPASKGNGQHGRSIELEQRKAELGDEILDLLGQAAADACVHVSVAEGVVIRAAFLVEQAFLKGFGQRLSVLSRRLSGIADLGCTGPLPPYSFATVKTLMPAPDAIHNARQLLGLGETITEKQLASAYRHRTALSQAEGKEGDGAQAFLRLTCAYALLKTYYREQAYGASRERRCSLAPQDVGRAVLLTVQRSDRTDSDEWPWIAAEVGRGQEQVLSCCPPRALRATLHRAMFAAPWETDPAEEPRGVS